MSSGRVGFFRVSSRVSSPSSRKTILCPRVIFFRVGLKKFGYLNAQLFENNLCFGACIFYTFENFYKGFLLYFVWYILVGGFISGAPMVLRSMILLGKLARRRRGIFWIFSQQRKFFRDNDFFCLKNCL